MSYEGHNHAVIRLQLELLSYWFTIVVQPGRMMEDANYFSCLGKNIYIDPLIKDCLSFAWQRYVINPADKGEVTQDNLPGRRKSKIPCSEHPTQPTISFANLKFNRKDLSSPIEHLISPELEPTMQQVPIVVFKTTSEMQPKLSHHFSYIGEVAHKLQSTSWILYRAKIWTLPSSLSTTRTSLQSNESHRK
jgi:hypothetical protein